MRPAKAQGATALKWSEYYKFVYNNLGPNIQIIRSEIIGMIFLYEKKECFFLFFVFFFS